jgi:hypothetical protein
MKTTHEKLLTSLLALGLTSSAGLYAQIGIGSTSPINSNLGDFAGLQSWTYADEAFLPSEDLNGDGILNNGGTGAPTTPGGPTTFLPGEGPRLNEFLDQVDYDGNGTIDADNATALANNSPLLNEDRDSSGFITGFEDRDGDGNLDVNEDIDGDNQLDITRDLNGDGIVNNGGTGAPTTPGGPNTLLAGEGGLLDEVADNVDYNGDGTIDNTQVSEIRSGDNARFVNEDIDGDGNLDLFNEDVNRNGTLDTDLPNRNFMASLDADGDLQDIDFLVENGLFVNGEMVATENYVDAADARLQAQIDTNVRDIAKNREDIETNTRGIAMVAALQHTTVLPGMTNALDISAAHFEGETGMALNYARRINENVQINFGAASTTDFDESVIKAGVGIQW